MLTLISAGDFCAPLLTRSAAELGLHKKLFDRDIIEFVSSADISTINLEAPLTDHTIPSPKAGPTIKCPPAAIQAIKHAGFKTAVLANNHTMDYGPTGLNDTIAACADAGISIVGAAQNSIEAQKPLFLNIGSTRIAILAFAEHESGIATTSAPGAALFDPITSPAAIRAARPLADILIVNVHGGREYFPIPSPRFRSWCKCLIDAGADAVIGHHPHVSQGIEYYKSKPIVYSLGHLFFNWPVNRPTCWYEGIISKIKFDSGQITADFIGCRQTLENGIPVCTAMPPARLDRYRAAFDEVSGILKDDQTCDDLWKTFCLSKAQSYFANLRLTASALNARLNFKSAFKSRDLSTPISQLIADTLRPKKHNQPYKRRLLNLLSCPSHLDVLQTLLEIELASYRPPPHIASLCQSLNQSLFTGL